MNTRNNLIVFKYKKCYYVNLRLRLPNGGNMKKILLGFCLAALVLPLFADDALVMPAHVIRTYLVGVYANTAKAYDNDGKKQDLPNGIDSIKAFNLGAAVEYGINDWVTAAVQWVPGYNISSTIDGTGMDKATLADTADLFVGTKLQIVGPKAPVQNESIRFAFAPGVKIPLSKHDYEKEADNAKKGDNFLLSSADKHLFGIGGRGFFDYVVNEMVFLNLYSQFIYYPGSIKAVDYSLEGYKTVAGTQFKTSDTSYDPSFKLGYDFTLEFEPHFNKMLNEGIEFEAGLPFTYTASPALNVSDDTYDVYADTNASHLLTMGPNVSLFFQKTFIPLELELGYTFPLLGKNDTASDMLLLELKAYAKL
jgi:hypothetical protein